METIIPLLATIFMHTRVDQKVCEIFKKFINFTKTTYIHELISQHSCHSGQCTSHVDVSRFEDRL